MRVPHVLALLLAVATASQAQDAGDTAQARAGGAPPMRIVISIAQRTLRVVSDSGETLRVVPIAVGSGRTLVGAERTWVFRTPRGAATVVEKQKDPQWIAPDWHYIELARMRDYDLVRMDYGTRVELSRGRTLLIRGDSVGILSPDSTFTRSPPGDIVLGHTLYMPPLGTVNRGYPDVLGAYRLLLDNGVGIHGTNEQQSIGKAVTHGCIRVGATDIAWLYETIPVGASVVIQ